MSKLFSKYIMGKLEVANRIVVAPMCQYSAVNGQATDWHLMHWGNLLNSGAGLFIIEATAVNPEGRITPACLGLWDDKTQSALANNLNRARKLAPKIPIVIQLAHAGRKASSAVPWEGGKLLDLDKSGWETYAPSAIPLADNERFPIAMSKADIDKVINDFVLSAQRAEKIGVDGIELHSAHGYLLHQFLSPISNKRSDHYGGSWENRIRFPLQVFRSVRQVYSGTLGIRVSATDWIDGGWDIEECTRFALELMNLGCDYIHVSSGGLSREQKIIIQPNYQVHFAERIKKETGIPTIAVGLITDPHQAEGIIQQNQADMVALARAFLYKPRWAWEAAAVLKGQVNSSAPYWRCMPQNAQFIFGSVKIGQR